MPNHVHIALVPSDPDGLWRTRRDLHRHYTGYVNARRRMTGHLWQGRYGSVAMGEAHFVTALCYIALNPVRARLVERAQDWPWSSARAILTGEDDHVVTVAPALERVGEFAAFLDEPFDEALSYAALRKAESVGRRPIGSPACWLTWKSASAAHLRRKSADQKASVRMPEGVRPSPRAVRVKIL